MQLLRWIGRCLDFLRRLVLNVVFYGILILAAALWYWSEPEAPAIGPRTVMVLDLRGPVVESDPMRLISADMRMFTGKGAESTRLIDVVEALDRAAMDPDIAGVEIVTGDLTRIGLASARTIGNAVERFKSATGRPVYAWSESFSQGQYAAAVHADEISLHPMGLVMLRGLSGANLYWGKLLEHVGIGVSVYKAGAFKSAPEIFTSDAPSRENLEAQKSWMDASWQGLTGDIEKARGLMPGAVDKYLRELPARLNDGEDPAEILKTSGFVTDLLTEDEFEEKLAKRFAEGGDKTKLKRIDYLDYLNATDLPDAPGSGVTVVFAEGTISSGAASGISPEELCERLERAAKTPGTRALVLRISSPGGDAIAAEAIREKLAAIRARGIHVVASMGDTAASGGYWISLGAERIIADPLTLTGSIGVFSVIPDAEGLLAEFDVGRDGYRTGELAEFGSPLHRPNAAESAILHSGVERVYDRFKALAANNRGRTEAEIEKVAQGRVWTGAQALEHGLVDSLGDLSDAVKVARQLADLPDDAPVRYFDAEPDGMSALVAKLSGEVLAMVPKSASMRLFLLPVASEPEWQRLEALLKSRRVLAWAEVPEGI